MHIHWHRRDLRGADNRALVRASEDEPVVALFVLDPTVLDHASPIRVACLLDALAALREWYRERGSDLVVARGEASEVVPAVAAAYDADSAGWNEDYTGLARDRDRAVTAALEDAGIEARSVHDALCHEPGSISPNRGEHYAVFSYFWKKWRDREKPAPYEPPAAAALADRATLERTGGVYGPDSLPTASELGFEPPEAAPPTVTPAAARHRLDAFCTDGIYRYERSRDFPARAATSRLSVHLKWGTIGVREVYAATGAAFDRAGSTDTPEAARSSVESFRRQLAWREFYAHIVAFTPELVTENGTEYDHGIEWRNDEAELAAWKAGETGYPIVDAGMRQLRSEGWVHNRVRMLVASFLTKDLLVDWRRGYAWYRARLADHDTVNDVSGWQWAASTGVDAQPYFRVFNPMKQGREYDPDAEYIRTHVPELADAPTADIHRWHELSPDERDAVAPGYPSPVVDHAERRERAIETFERARK